VAPPLPSGENGGGGVSSDAGKAPQSDTVAAVEVKDWLEMMFGVVSAFQKVWE
jgi:hypothetical protein